MAPRKKNISAKIKPPKGWQVRPRDTGGHQEASQMSYMDDRRQRERDRIAARRLNWMDLPHPLQRRDRSRGGLSLDDRRCQQPEVVPPGISAGRMLHPNERQQNMTRMGGRPTSRGPPACSPGWSVAARSRTPRTSSTRPETTGTRSRGHTSWTRRGPTPPPSPPTRTPCSTSE